MNEIIATFEPTSTTQATLWLGGAVALLALGALLAILAGKLEVADRNRRLLLAMLLFFTVLIAGGTAFFSWLTSYRIDTVTLYSRGLTTPYGTVAYEDIRDAYIRKEEQRSFVNPDIVRSSTRLLIIEERDGKTHVLSEENYALEPIFSTLRQQME